jgi:hypothetical protein
MKVDVWKFAAVTAILSVICMTSTASSANRFNNYYKGTTADCDTGCDTEEEACDTEEAACDTGCEADCGCDGNGCDSCGCDSCCGWCNLGDPWTLQKCENCWGITYGGWMQFGYHSEHTPLSFPGIGPGTLFSFNDYPGKLNAHQVSAYVEKEAEGEGYWDFGFRADLMYGTDAQKTQAFGGNPASWDNPWDHGFTHGWAVPQLYVTADRDDLTITAGHFYTLIGYEVVTAPDNFFYSHALTMFNSEPFTHTGVLAAYNPYGGDTTYYGGWTMGWDTAFEAVNGGSNFLGGVSTSVAENVTATYILTLGDMGARGQGYSHSVVIDWEINDRWEYVCQSDLVWLDAEVGVNDGFGNDQVGVNQYLFYTVNDCVKAGVRGEWWKTDGFSRYAVTAGVNVRPHANLVVRPEVRYDWGADPLGVFTNEGIFAIDAVLTF